MAIQKGTGFTNLNRILQANRGNNLGQTIAGGIRQQTQGVNSQVKSAQNQFQEEAQKNRLDTQESIENRSGVLGKFNEDNYKVDESKFTPSSGLQDQYSQQKQNLTNQQTAYLQDVNKNRQSIQDQINKLNQYNAQSQAIDKQFSDWQQQQKQQMKANRGIAGATYNTNFDLYTDVYQPGQATRRQLNQALPEELRKQIEQFNATYGADKTLNPTLANYGDYIGGSKQFSSDVINQGIGSLNNLLKSLDTSTAAKNSEYSNQLSALEKQFADMTAKEKQDWIQQQKDAAIAANLPSEEEISDFAKYIRGVYSGPKELTDVSSLYGKAQQAEELGGLSRVEGGRQELLRRFVGGNDYTQGQKKLDSILLGQDPNALRSASRETRGLINSVDLANRNASNIAQEYVGKAKQFGEETKNLLESTRAPISNKIDEQVTNLSQKEKARETEFKNLQAILTGNDSKYKNLDASSRTALALQSALDSGYLSQQEAMDLVGSGGLISRANQLGLDVNKLLAERLQQSSALGIDRTAAASSDQKARISALDKLMGKTGTDVEFGNAKDNYQAGDINLNTSSLRDFIAKTEAEKLRSDPKYAQQLAAQGYSPLSQILAGTQKISDGNIAGGAANLAAGGASVLPTGQAALINALAKSTGNSQLAELAKSYSDIQNVGLGELGNAATTYAQGFGNLQQGKLDQALGNLTGVSAIQNIANKIGSGFGAGSTGNWATEELPRVDVNTGKQTNIGSFANKSSDYILKQLMNEIKYATSFGNSGAEGAKGIQLLTQYYNDALKRERSGVKLT